MTTPSSIPQELRLLRRKDYPTPPWLRNFAKELYGNECLICGERRLLEVAHLVNWEGVTGELDRINALYEHQVFGPDAAFWIFHQPVNVVLLCSWCHGLYDSGDPEVPISRILEARDQVLATERAARVVLNYFCRGWLGQIGGSRGNAADRWAPMLDWLKRAWEAGLLPGPHRFFLRPVEMVDLSQGKIIVKNDLDQSLPRWTRHGFMTGDEGNS